MNQLRPIVIAAAIIIAAFLSGAGPSRGQPPVKDSLVGRLLIASPTIRDPRFDHAVILVVHHDQGGAMGIVINNPAEERQLADVLKLVGEKDPNATGMVRVFAGGPVQPNVGFVIHSPDYRDTRTIIVSKDVLVTSNIQILQDIGHHKGPKKSIIAFGYAGWAPGQLEDELRRRLWFTTLADPALVFDEDRDKVWDSAYARRIQEL